MEALCRSHPPSLSEDAHIASDCLDSHDLTHASFTITHCVLVSECSFKKTELHQPKCKFKPRSGTATCD